MSDTDPEIEIVETEVGPPPSGTPRRFRELVALALKTTDPAVLDTAELDYRGGFDGVDAFVRGQVAEHLPAHFATREALHCRLITWGASRRDAGALCDSWLLRDDFLLAQLTGSLMSWSATRAPPPHIHRGFHADHPTA